MTTDVKEFAKQTIDELSESEVMELWEYLNSLHKKHETVDQEVCGKFREALDALLQECSADNWDGYGAKALQFGSYREALRFVQSLPTTIPVPELAADPDGAIAFEWDNGPRRIFSISVGDSGELIYAGIFGNSKTHGTEFFEDGIPKILLDHLQRLFL